MIKEGYRPEGKNLDPGDPPGQKTMTREEVIKIGESWIGSFQEEDEPVFKTLLSHARECPSCKRVEEMVKIMVEEVTILDDLINATEAHPINQAKAIVHAENIGNYKTLKRYIPLLTEGRPEGKETKPPPTPLPSEGMSPRGSK